MNETTQVGDIYKALPAISREIHAIEKKRRNEAQRFMFRGIDDLLNALHPLFAKHEVIILVDVVSKETSERQTSRGGSMQYSTVQVKYTFVASDGSRESATSIGEAADLGDKSLAKAMTMAYKTMLTEIFLIPTEDLEDPDANSVEFIDKGMLEQALAEMSAAQSTAEVRAIYSKYEQLKKDKTFYELTAKMGTYWKKKEAGDEA